VASSGTIPIDPLDSDEFRFLCIRFSSGLTLKELRSVALVVAKVAGHPPPPRASLRNFQVLVEWFIEHWSVLMPILPFIGLADAEGIPIDGRREVFEKGLGRLVL
jgi:hypothetical protein